MFDGIEIDNKQSLLYNTVFMTRRFYIVIINLLLNSGNPWNSFDESRYFYKIILFLLITYVKILFVIDTRPHTQTVYNRLEFINEGALIVLANVMIAFSGIVEG